MKVSSKAQKLIDEINEKSSKKRAIEESIEKSKKEEFLGNLAKIKALGDKIFDMWKIAETLLSNEIQFNKFRTDGINHRLGFFVNNDKINGFGMEGGGWSGYDLVLNQEGVPTSFSLEEKYNESGNINYPWNVGSIVGKVEALLEEFDDYEKSFMDFVQGILDE